jgi:hypothetical protein
MKRFWQRVSEGEIDAHGNEIADRQNGEVGEGGSGSTPERLMMAITSSMGEVVQNPQEFEELTALLISKSREWVRGAYLVRSHNARVEAKQGKPPLIL